MSNDIARALGLGAGLQNSFGGLGAAAQQLGAYNPYASSLVHEYEVARIKDQMREEARKQKQIQQHQQQQALLLLTGEDE